MKPIPASAEDLIKELSSAYPQRCIQPDETPASAHRRAGAADLVESLVIRLEWTRKHAITPETNSHVYRRQ